MANTPSIKRLQIDRATSSMVLAVSIATFIVIFTLISGNSLLKVLKHRDLVISAQSKAVNQLHSDISASKTLITSYENFDNTNTNLVGSPTTGTAQNDGPNSKIILDALPSEYDAPAFGASLQYLLTNKGVSVDGITSTADQTTSSPTTGSGPVAVPLSYSVDGPYQNIQNVISTFEKSILTFQIQTLSLSGGQNDMTMSVTGQSNYDPATSFNITHGDVN